MEVDLAVHEFRIPEVAGKLILSSFIGVVEAVEHQAVLQLARAVVVALARTKHTGLDVSLALACAKKYVLSAAPLQAALRDLEVFAIVSVDEDSTRSEPAPGTRYGGHR